MILQRKTEFGWTPRDRRLLVDAFFNAKDPMAHVKRMTRIQATQTFLGLYEYFKIAEFTTAKKKIARGFYVISAKVDGKVVRATDELFKRRK